MMGLTPQHAPAIPRKHFTVTNAPGLLGKVLQVFRDDNLQWPTMAVAST